MWFGRFTWILKKIRISVLDLEFFKKKERESFDSQLGGLFGQKPYVES